MFLLVAPTKKELSLLTEGLEKNDRVSCFVCGVGVLESAVSFSNYLARSNDRIEGVVLTGIAGAYRDNASKLLDICLASREIIGDLGVCYPDRIDPLDESFSPVSEFQPDSKLLSKARDILTEKGMVFHEGVFVTVSSVSGTALRGDYLRQKFGAICENMEGAAVARVCQEFKLPFIEIRCVSNMVLDREIQRWDIDGAIARCSEAVGIIMEQLAGES